MHGSINMLRLTLVMAIGLAAAYAIPASAASAGPAFAGSASAGRASCGLAQPRVCCRRGRSRPLKMQTSSGALAVNGYGCRAGRGESTGSRSSAASMGGLAVELAKILRSNAVMKTLMRGVGLYGADATSRRQRKEAMLNGALYTMFVQLAADDTPSAGWKDDVSRKPDLAFACTLPSSMRLSDFYAAPLLPSSMRRKGGAQMELLQPREQIEATSWCAGECS